MPEQTKEIIKRLTMLSPRERQISALLCEGLSNKMIARKLKVSEGTVKSHLHAIFRKVDVVSRYELSDVLDRCRSG